MLDGVRQRYESAGGGGFLFSPDGSRTAYAAKVQDKELIILDGKEGEPYDNISKGTLVFSSDSKRLAYGVGIGVKWAAVADGVRHREYDEIAAITFLGGRMVYAAQADGKWSVVVDESEGNRYEGIVTGSIFLDSVDHLRYLAMKEGKILSVNETLQE